MDINFKTNDVTNETITIIGLTCPACNNHVNIPLPASTRLHEKEAEYWKARARNAIAKEYAFMKKIQRSYPATYDTWLHFQDEWRTFRA